MLNNLLILQSITLILISFLASVIGSFLIWRRSIFLIDSLAHAAIFSVIIADFCKIPLFLSIFLFSNLFALLLVYFENKKQENNTTICLIANFFLILSLIILSTNTGENDLHHFEHLFMGDLLYVNHKILLYIASTAVIAAILLCKFWKMILLFIVDPDSMKIAGKNYTLYSYFFHTLIIFTICLCLQSIGVLLAVAIFLLPTIIVSKFAKNPLQMILYSFFLNLLVNNSSLILNQYQNLTSINLTIAIINFVIFFSIIFAKNKYKI